MRTPERDFAADVLVISMSNRTGTGISGVLAINAESRNHEGTTEKPDGKTQSFTLTADEMEKQIDIIYHMGDSVRLSMMKSPNLKIVFSTRVI